MPSFTTFVLMHNCLSGIGIGFVFFLPIVCGWSFFPTLKPFVGGAILSWGSLSDLWWFTMARNTLNPNKEKPHYDIKTSSGLERYCKSDSS